MGWYTAQYKMLLFVHKTHRETVTQFELALSKEEEEEEERKTFWRLFGLVLL